MAAVCAAAIVIILLAFSETAESMVGIWRSSETFSHGFFIVPIALWLVWRKRDELSRVGIRPYWPGLPLVGGAGFLWMLGELADANVVKHFALVFMLQGTVLVILGLALTRALAFPLLFLLFAVPFGEAFVPKLMDWTADFTVLALKLTGVPVYREGNNFVIPSGNWSVVEACSGIRYLIASLMAGTLFAHLMYRSTSRRLMFITAALLVPILANWLRAYAIVMLGHLSANELATGVDHLIYGWVFFGIVLFVMFSVGARWREDGDAPASESRTVAIEVGNWKHVALAALAAVAVAVTWSPLSALLLAADAGRQWALAPIEATAGWQAVDTKSVDSWRPNFAGSRAELHQTFERGGDRVVVSIYYYGAQAQGRELINSTNVLVTTKDPLWQEVGRGQMRLDGNGSGVEARTATLAGKAGRFDVAWWYWVDGRTTTSDSIAKILLAWSRLLLQSDDSAAVFLSTEPSGRADGLELLRRFGGDMGKSIDHALTTAREAGR
jgi:exosortase A